MGVLYIIIRTFPFWAIPMGIVILGSWMRKKTRPKGLSGVLWLVLSLCLLAGSVVFLIFKGQFTAVPYMHDVLNGSSKLR